MEDPAHCNGEAHLGGEMKNEENGEIGPKLSASRFLELSLA